MVSLSESIDGLKKAFFSPQRENTPALEKLNSHERDFFTHLIQGFREAQGSVFPKDVDFLIILAGGIVTGIHNKSPEERDIDVAINFSSPTDTPERLAVVTGAEAFLTSFLDRHNLDYTQLSGSIPGTGIDGRNGIKGWTTTELEFGGQKHMVKGLLDRFPEVRFVTKLKGDLHCFDIMILGVNDPNIDDHLKWQGKSKKAYEVIWDSRK